MNEEDIIKKDNELRSDLESLMYEKFAMRVYLNRIGFIGPEYKNYREHLIKHLDGSAAWRYGSDDPRYKKNKKEEK